MRRFYLAVLILALAPMAHAAKIPDTDSRLKGAYRRPPQDGWTYVHLEGTPSQIGYQHGWLLSREIEAGFAVQKLEAEHETEKKWEFFREAARTILWPRVENEYREELEGITAGLNARGVKLDIWDVVALNASMEWSYYTQQYDKQHGIKPPKTLTAPEHCSAFVATGSYTKDGKIVVAHNNWTSYLDGEHWTIV